MYNAARSFQDLEVYQNLYKAMITVLTRVIPALPKEEKFDLSNQMRRACKAPPALLAEGYAKKNHRKQWQKYLNDAIGECNEMIVHLSCAKDVYLSHIDPTVCLELIKTYDIGGKQLYRLAESWKVPLMNPQPTPTTRLTTHNTPSQHTTMRAINK